jgi:hypothetical protein
VVYIGVFVMNDGALRAVKKLYIRLCAARDKCLLNKTTYPDDVVCSSITSLHSDEYFRAAKLF